MARGKYSPTVSHAYYVDQQWWVKYAYKNQLHKLSNEFVEFDPEGFDSYGYNKDGVDRAGNDEFVYLSDDNDAGDNFTYDRVYGDWGFDVNKPALWSSM